MKEDTICTLLGYYEPAAPEEPSTEVSDQDIEEQDEDTQRATYIMRIRDLIIDVNGQKHVIHRDYLKQMQSKNFREEENMSSEAN